jgi:hypothetical protein
MIGVEDDGKNQNRQNLLYPARGNRPDSQPRLSRTEPTREPARTSRAKIGEAM